VTRVSVPVRDELKAGIEEHPDEFDLDPSLSEARRYALLLEEGARARRMRRRERARQEAYAAYAADPSHRESVEELFTAALDDGIA
jgi:Arc/MetJ-type ribon-helix-helix transcriptional regulator